MIERDKGQWREGYGAGVGFLFESVRGGQKVEIEILRKEEFIAVTKCSCRMYQKKQCYLALKPPAERNTPEESSHEQMVRRAKVTGKDIDKQNIVSFGFE